MATKQFDSGLNNAHSRRVGRALLETAWEISSIGYEATMLITRHQPDVLMTYRRMVFNVLAYNRNDRAKQHAYLMSSDGTWRLAPSYDLTFSAGPGGEHYLTVNGRGRDITRSDIERVAENQGIAAKRAREIVDEVAAGIRRFREFAQTYGLRRSSISEIQTAIDTQLSSRAMRTLR